MTTLEAAGVTLGVIFIVIGMIFLPILLVNLIDHIIKSIRKEKYPEYFELYETAVSESFRIGGRFSAEKRRIEYYLKLYSEGYKDGECTKKDFEDKMLQLTNMYVRACNEYNTEYATVKDFLKKADIYAKQHNLKWGIIYDN